MPKGRQLITLNTANSIECKKTGTSRIFQSKKELKPLKIYDHTFFLVKQFLQEHIS